MTVKDIEIHEKYFFSKYGIILDDFKKKFISTGDGGFQIFDNPLQAIIFSLYFQAFLKRYCTGGSINQIDKNLFQIIDAIDLRFAISYDKVYWYNNNYFGPAIINNARILSRDSLNRLLVDANTIKWLSRNINAPENLLDIDINSLSNTSFFKTYDKKLTSYLFDKAGKILALDIQKIGTLTAKETKLDIFNMHLQAKLSIKVEHQDYGIYIITLGNLNTSGIDNKNSA